MISYKCVRLTNTVYKEMQSLAEEDSHIRGERGSHSLSDLGFQGTLTVSVLDVMCEVI